MTENIELVLQHLRLESNFLDSVIESSEEIQKILRESRESQMKYAQTRSIEESTPETRIANSALQLERNQRTSARLKTLRQEFANKSQVINQSRKSIPEILKRFDPDCTQTLSLSSILTKIEQPHRSKLESIRTEIQTKIKQVYSISMGNQAVLIYTLDYYDRLLFGSRSEAGCYNSSGQTQTINSASVLETNC